MTIPFTEFPVPYAPIVVVDDAPQSDEVQASMMHLIERLYVADQALQDLEQLVAQIERLPQMAIILQQADGIREWQDVFKNYWNAAQGPLNVARNESQNMKKWEERLTGEVLGFKKLNKALYDEGPKFFAQAYRMRAQGQEIDRISALIPRVMEQSLQERQEKIDELKRLVQQAEEDNGSISRELARQPDTPPPLTDCAELIKQLYRAHSSSVNLEGHYSGPSLNNHSSPKSEPVVERFIPAASSGPDQQGASPPTQSAPCLKLTSVGVQDAAKDPHGANGKPVKKSQNARKKPERSKTGAHSTLHDADSALLDKLAQAHELSKWDQQLIAAKDQAKKIIDEKSALQDMERVNQHAQRLHQIVPDQQLAEAMSTLMDVGRRVKERMSVLNALIIRNMKLGDSEPQYKLAIAAIDNERQAAVEVANELKTSTKTLVTSINHAVRMSLDRWIEMESDKNKIPQRRDAADRIFRTFTDADSSEGLALLFLNLTNVPEVLKYLMPGLIKLDLSGNKLSDLPDSLLELGANLQELLLGDNRFEVLSPNLFRSLSNLKVLTLDRNRLSVIPDLSENNCMKHLSLSRNELTSDCLSLNIFKNMSDLQFLDLSWNHISVLPNGLLENNKEIKTLRLRGNNLQVLYLEELKSLSNLNELDLGLNPNLKIMNEKGEEETLSSDDLCQKLRESYCPKLTSLYLESGKNTAA